MSHVGTMSQVGTGIDMITSVDSPSVIAVIVVVPAACVVVVVAAGAVAVGKTSIL